MEVRSEGEQSQGVRKILGREKGKEQGSDQKTGERETREPKCLLEQSGEPPSTPACSHT